MHMVNVADEAREMDEWNVYSLSFNALLLLYHLVFMRMKMNKQQQQQEKTNLDRTKIVKTDCNQ